MYIYINMYIFIHIYIMCRVFLRKGPFLHTEIQIAVTRQILQTEATNTPPFKNERGSCCSNFCFPDNFSFFPAFRFFFCLKCCFTGVSPAFRSDQNRAKHPENTSLKPHPADKRIVVR